ncbi:sacsin-like [Planoprotostelium fungivorum]|uniref:Sacsin-like n=1 Tax=Planoprotostelium fungivorum TaxID=1890364 RepID=A0A2P6N288_9EUKA|nr:sacsin-like [Planoprotostelium fungivorum]
MVIQFGARPMDPIQTFKNLWAQDKFTLHHQMAHRIEVIAARLPIEVHVRKLRSDDVIHHLESIGSNRNDRMHNTLYKEIAICLQWITKNGMKNIVKLKAIAECGSPASFLYIQFGEISVVYSNITGKVSHSEERAQALQTPCWSGKIFGPQSKTEMVLTTDLRQEQSFEVTVRNTLAKYPFGIGAFQGARRCHVIFNADRGWIDIFNDEYFRDEKRDWQGFTKNIGNSGKKENVNAIGTFGLGAITMYHLSNVIAVVSGDKALLLDSFRKEGLAKKGLDGSEVSLHGEFKGENLQRFKMFQPIVEQEEEAKWSENQRYPGTLIALTLRTKGSEVKPMCIIVAEVKKWLEDCGSRLSGMLIFLRHLEEIKITIIEGNRKSIYKAAIQPDDHQVNRETFRQLRSKNPIDYLHYRITIDSTCPTDALSREKFLIVNGSGRIDQFDNKNKTVIKVNPRGGVAVSLTKEGIPQRCQGKAYTFMPILKDDLNLPVHVNGMFELNDNRTDLWMMSNDDRTRWNIFLLEEIINVLWARALLVLTQDVVCKDVKIDEWYSLWPHSGIGAPWNKIATKMIPYLKSYPISMSYVTHGRAKQNFIWVGQNLNIWADNASVESLAKMGILVVDAPKDTITQLTGKEDRQLVKANRSFIKELLLNHYKARIFTSLICRDLINLLEGDLSGLPVVPLSNGSYTTDKTKYKMWKQAGLLPLTFPDLVYIKSEDAAGNPLKFLEKHMNLQWASINDVVVAVHPDHKRSGFFREDETLSSDQRTRIIDILKKFSQRSDQIENLQLVELTNGQVCNFATAKFKVLFADSKLDEHIRQAIDLMGFLQCKNLEDVHKIYPVNKIEPCDLVASGLEDYLKRSNQDISCFLRDPKNACVLQCLMESKQKEKYINNLSGCSIIRTQSGHMLSASEVKVFLPPSVKIASLDQVLSRIFHHQLPADRKMAIQFGAKAVDPIDTFKKLWDEGKLTHEDKEKVAKEMCTCFNLRNDFVSFLRDRPCVWDGNQLLPMSRLTRSADLSGILGHGFLPHSWVEVPVDVLHRLGLESDLIPIIPSVLDDYPERASLVLQWLSTVQDITKIKDLKIFKAMPHTGPHETSWRLQFLPDNQNRFFSLTELVRPDSATSAWTAVSCISTEAFTSHPKISQHLKILSPDDVMEHLLNIVNRIIPVHGTNEMMYGTLYREISECLKWIDKFGVLKIVTKLKTKKWMTLDRIDFDMNEDDEDEEFTVMLPDYLKPFESLMARCGFARSVASLSVKINPPPKPKPMVYQFERFFMKKEMADVFYVWEEREIPAHKIILACHSIRFMTQFEKFHDHRVLLKTEEEFHAMQKIMRYLYTGIMDDPHQEFGTILELSRMYMLSSVITELEIAMFPRCRGLRDVDLLHLFGYAKDYKMDALKRYVKALLEKKREKMVHKTNLHMYLDVDPETLVETLGVEFALRVDAVGFVKGYQRDNKKINFELDEELIGFPKEEAPRDLKLQVKMKTEKEVNAHVPKTKTAPSRPSDLHSNPTVSMRQTQRPQQAPVKKAVATPPIAFEMTPRRGATQQAETQVPGYKTKDCIYFLEGKCFKGDNCTYIHDKQKKPYYK